MGNILETKNLCKRFKKQMANNHIALHVKENSIYGLLGPNGAGKSTLLKILTGMQTPTSGEILFNGVPLERHMLSEIGALIENPPIYENLTARENLKVRTLMYGLPDTRIDQVLQIVKLTDTGKKKAGKFSLGMKQRLGIATALLNHPKLLILDEPTNGIAELRELIKSLPEQNVTVIISSHVLSEIEHIVSDIGIIVEGQLLYEAPIDHSQDLENLFFNIAKKAGEHVG